jgi:hypothetical protein
MENNARLYVNIALFALQLTVKVGYKYHMMAPLNSHINVTRSVFF